MVVRVITIDGRNSTVVFHLLPCYSDAASLETFSEQGSCLLKTILVVIVLLKHACVCDRERERQYVCVRERDGDSVL